MVPLSKAVQQVPLGELSKATTLQQSFLLRRFEDSIRQHEHACAEKKLLEERLKVKSENCESLKGEVESKQKESSGVIPSDILKIQHLDKLYQTIECSDPKKTCRSHWRDVGSQLGFSTQELDDIYCENKKRSGDKNYVCTKEMLRRWLQRTQQ